MSEIPMYPDEKEHPYCDVCGRSEAGLEVEVCRHCYDAAKSGALRLMVCGQCDYVHPAGSDKRRARLRCCLAKGHDEPHAAKIEDVLKWCTT